MFFQGFIPIRTKLYLKNRELVNVENLKFGDEILSIKLLDTEITNPADIFYKYFISKDIKRIYKNDLELSSSIITNICRVDSSKNDLVKVNDNEAIFNNQIFIASDPNPDSSEIQLLRTAWLTSESSLDLSKIAPGYLNKDIKTDTKNILLFDKEISSCSVVNEKLPMFSISLSNNNFYLTENFILLGASV